MSSPRWWDLWKDRLCIYRCFNAERTLLYVGFTRHWPQRLATHGSKSFWWPEVRKTTIKLHPHICVSDVERLERVAIATEKPRYNLADRAPRPEWDISEYRDFLNALERFGLTGTRREFHGVVAAEMLERFTPQQIADLSGAPDKSSPAMTR